MPYTLFKEFFPDIAERETRMLCPLESFPGKLPVAKYFFNELYCDEPGCDCRRVIFAVQSSLTNEFEATICYGWESRQFYVNWFGRDDQEMIQELQGPCLNAMSRQSRHAEEILDLARQALFSNPQYVERLKRHYAMFRAKVEEQAGHGPLPPIPRSPVARQIPAEEQAGHDPLPPMPVPGTDLQLKAPETQPPASGRIEEQYQDVLQNIEWTVIDFYRDHPAISDFTVSQVYDALARAYGAEAKGVTTKPIEMSSPEAELLDRVRSICEWRLGRGDLGGKGEVPLCNKIDIPTLVRCLKRLEKSVRKNTRDCGRQGYLNFVKRFV